LQPLLLLQLTLPAVPVFLKDALPQSLLRQSVPLFGKFRVFTASAKKSLPPFKTKPARAESGYSMHGTNGKILERPQY
jgi:hypothetical protein